MRAAIHILLERWPARVKKVRESLTKKFMAVVPPFGSVHMMKPFLFFNTLWSFFRGKKDFLQHVRGANCFVFVSFILKQSILSANGTCSIASLLSNWRP